MLPISLLLAAALQAPTPVALAADAEHHFGVDHLTSAEYLGLGADGRYVVVDVQHMFTRARDEGRWRVDGDRLFLESEQSVRQAKADDFNVYLYGRCAGAVLPELRASLQALHARGTPVQVQELQALRPTITGHPQGRGEDGNCGAAVSFLDFDDFDATAFAADRLPAVIQAIDAWLADGENQHIFEYQVRDYRGERFLVPMRSGMQPNQPSVAEIQESMDAGDGRRASYILYAIPAEEYARAVGCTYAFKFHAELNAPCNEP